MKKLFLALAIAGALTACNNEGDTKTGADSSATDSNASKMAPADTSNMNSTTPPMDTTSKMAPMDTMSKDKMMSDTTKKPM